GGDVRQMPRAGARRRSTLERARAQGARPARAAQHRRWLAARLSGASVRRRGGRTVTGGAAPHAARPAERSPGWQRELAGKRALVTGSSGGIGRHLALALAAAGADVAVHGRDDARTAAVAAEVERIGRRSLAVTGDLGGADAYRVSADVVGAVV